MKNILLKLTYDGTNYCGWQVQDNAPSICGEITKAIFKFSGENVKLVGCGRTDSKVHALNYYANFFLEKDFDVNTVKNALNHFLPFDIRIKEVFEKGMDFNSRYDVKSKEYIYVIDNGSFQNPFFINKAFYYNKNIDMELLANACKKFIGTYDFKAFMAAGSSVKDTVRTVYSCDIKKDGDKVIMSFCGNGFLYNMVRIMAGTLIFVNEKKIKINEIEDIIKSKDRKKAGKTLPGCGLYLKDVKY